VLANQGEGERHTARDCTAHAGIMGKELDELRWGGGESLVGCVKQTNVSDRSLDHLEDYQYLSHLLWITASILRWSSDHARGIGANRTR
jgi:hypothetical protein